MIHLNLLRQINLIINNFFISGTKRTREDDSKNGVKKRKKDENDDTEIIGKNLLNNDLDAVGSSKKKIFWLKNGNLYFLMFIALKIKTIS